MSARIAGPLCPQMTAASLLALCHCSPLCMFAKLMIVLSIVACSTIFADANPSTGSSSEIGSGSSIGGSFAASMDDPSRNNNYGRPEGQNVSATTENSSTSSAPMASCMHAFCNCGPRRRPLKQRCVHMQPGCLRKPREGSEFASAHMCCVQMLSTCW